MNTVSVTASRSYNVLIGAGLMDQLGEHISHITKSGKAAIISDSNVWPVYGQRVCSSLIKHGFDVISYHFPAGEESKNSETYLNILNFLAENKVTRSDILIAVGGGVVGDITGFAASTYLRGIRYIQIPTSLLAMVDSSVGGKTAIDLPAGKNLVGTFYQPSLVLCDTNALNTLPEPIFRDGCAEVIKYGVLYDPALFDHLSKNTANFDREYVITTCVTLKRNVVAEDEFDTGARMKLNLGHTIGHGIETCSNFSISHGQAVAAGMSIVSRAGISAGICDESIHNKIKNILTDFALPTDTTYSAKMLADAALSDKKRAGSIVNLIVPEAIGRCRIHPIQIEQLEDFIKAGL